MAQETTNEEVEAPPAEEASEEAPRTEATTGGGTLFSPEAILMLSIAVMLDLIGLFLFILSLFGIGLPLSFMLDIIGLVVIGGWMFLRSGRIGATKKVAKIFRKSLRRLGLAFVGELIPFFGDIAFCWTLLVYFELKSK